MAIRNFQLMKRSPMWEIFWIFLATRFILILVTYFGSILLIQNAHASTPVTFPTMFMSWNRWDALVYIRIAQSGYHPPLDLAFFPLYPLLIAAIAHSLGGWSYFAVGMLLSNGMLLGAMVIIYQLAKEIGGDQVARRALLYLCIFPTAFFFFTAYNESLFILLTAATFLALRHRCWRLAGLLGFFGVLTRSTGALIVVPFLYELWLNRKAVTATWCSLLSGLLPILLIPLGLLLYCIYCWNLAGDPIAFATVQFHWSRQASWPWQGVWQNIFELFWNQPFGSFNEVHVLLDLSATLAFIALVIAGRQQMRASYTLWTGLLLFYYLLSPSIWQHDALISNQRFVLEMFPAFITLAILGLRYPHLHQALLWIFPALLATLSLLFVMGKWMV
jgi:Gpi18-like mannosyltransferase